MKKQEKLAAVLKKEIVDAVLIQHHAVGLDSLHGVVMPTIIVDPNLINV